MTTLGITSPAGYTPQQIRHAYGFDQIPYNGAGTTIAIVDPGHDPNAFNDLQQFDRQVEAPQVIPDPPSFAQVNEYGQASNYPTMQSAAMSYETALDVEWAHAIAPGASILLVEFNATPAGTSSSGNAQFSANTSDILQAINTARSSPGVVAVSMSLSFSGIAGYDNYFTTPSGHTGVTFVAASGDSGGPSQWPASSSNVVSVGGTDLPLDPAGDYPVNPLTGQTEETAWAGSSGGITSEPKPAYQNGVVVQNGGLAITYLVRTTPDVGYNAGDGVAVYDSFANATAPWVSLIGTSAGAPQWAALIALADQGRAQEGVGITGWPEPDVAAAIPPAEFCVPRHHQREQRQF